MPSKIRNSLLWIFDAFEREPDYLCKRMFGCDAAYLDGLLCLVAADRDKPFNGLLVCTSRERQAALIAEMPALRPHPVLGKWLYVTQEDPEFEATAQHLTGLVLARDPRVGVEPKPRKSGNAAGKSGKARGNSVLPK
ncbi:hypothetical protein [Paraburkholderia sp. J63]|uniref:hypothetical protein n=1 Tax=Paraburkholderia sp. J63 TaxID=2805434 RepID=UPI002ABD9B6A|nr:hypothetical protein [Paraburkholderia sp. J63]